MGKEIFSFLRITNNFSKILVTTIILYFYKTAFWPITYLFITSYVILLISFLLISNWKFRIAGFFLDFMPPFILAGIFIVAFLINGNYTVNVVLKDILLLAVLFSLFYFLHWNNRVLDRHISKSFTFNLIIVTSALISVLNLINLLFISSVPPKVISNLNISDGLTIAFDNNFFCLLILLGFILLNFDKSGNPVIRNHPYQLKNLLNIVFILSIILSGSRRGIFIFVILLSIQFLYTYVFIQQSFIPKNFIKKIYLSILIFAVALLIVISVYQILPRNKLSNLLYRYAMLVGIDNSNSIEKFLWLGKTELPKVKNHLIDAHSFVTDFKCWNEYASSGTELSAIDTPYGRGIKLSREGGDDGGISLNFFGPKILYYADHTYKISFKIKFIKGDFNSFNVGWWIDDGGKGFSNASALEKEVEPLGDEWYTCTSKYTFIDNHIGLIGFFNAVLDKSSFIAADFELVDLDYNPMLPRYAFECEGIENLNRLLDKYNNGRNETNLINNGDFKDDLVFWKHSSDSLTIKIENINGRKCAYIYRGDGNEINWSLYYTGRNVEFKKNNEYQLSFKLKLVSSKSIPFNVGYWVNEGEGYKTKLNLSIDTLNDGWLNIKAKYTFKNDHNDLLFPINSQIDNSKFYITDLRLENLTQQQYQVAPHFNLTDKTRNESFFSDRSSRWLYAVELWKTKYKWNEKIIGHGFDYLEWYGVKFLNDSKSYDWPHNPFLSILLYSGIVGLLFYIWLLFKVITLYIKYRKYYRIAFIGFLMTFFFTFFSGSSPFDPPIMGFFIMLPFFIHSIHKRTDEQQNMKNMTDENTDNRQS